VIIILFFLLPINKLFLLFDFIMSIHSNPINATLPTPAIDRSSPILALLSLSSSSSPSSSSTPSDRKALNDKLDAYRKVALDCTSPFLFFLSIIMSSLCYYVYLDVPLRASNRRLV
jgi:hypothetical protein